jgi:putative NADPH-quinone reductase
MNISVILAHPDEKSFNHAIARTAVARLQTNGHSVIFHDLHAERFDPIILSEEIPREGVLTEEIAKHCDEVSSADGVVIVHPNWWGQPPAILKGWVDRVIRPGVAYAFLEGDKGEGVPVGLLEAHTAVVFNTGNTPLQREREIFGDPLQLIWKNCIFDLCGVETFHRELFTVVVTSTYEERQTWLKRVEDVMDQYFPLSSALPGRSSK